MNQRTTFAFSEGARELQELCARLRQVHGYSLAEGQTPYCYALSSHHPLLWGLRKFLHMIPQGLSRLRPAGTSPTNRKGDHIMKRLHVHVSVESIDKAVQFYSVLFASEPTIIKSDYAKWMLDDPRVNFAISTRGNRQGLDHLGIQTESPEELQEIYGRLRRAGGSVLEVGPTTCCYAKSEKSWIDDPADIAWETFLTTGTSTIYGDSSKAESGARVAHAKDCCTPRPAQVMSACC